GGRDDRLRAQGRRRHQALPRRGRPHRPHGVSTSPRLAMARSLGAAMVRFGTLLRRQGLPITPEYVTDGARALEHLDLTDREEVRTGLRAVFTTRPEDFAIFDRCFDAFWRVTSEADRVAEALAPALPDEAPLAPQQGSGRESLALDAWNEPGG